VVSLAERAQDRGQWESSKWISTCPVAHAARSVRRHLCLSRYEAVMEPHETGRSASPFRPDSQVRDHPLDYGAPTIHGKLASWVSGGRLVKKFHRHTTSFTGSITQPIITLLVTRNSNSSKEANIFRQTRPRQIIALTQRSSAKYATLICPGAWDQFPVRSCLAA
jgi:hypothetical protein